jgi:hypothetical protein
MKPWGRPCPYIAAYDVYSIGVVIVALILESLNGGQAIRNSQCHDVFEINVNDERDQQIVDRWEKLKRDAYPTITWNPASLELACKAAQTRIDVHHMMKMTDLSYFALQDTFS